MSKTGWPSKPLTDFSLTNGMKETCSILHIKRIIAILTNAILIILVSRKKVK